VAVKLTVAERTFVADGPSPPPLSHKGRGEIWSSPTHASAPSSILEDAAE
jgi:hypothetical protein